LSDIDWYKEDDHLAGTVVYRDGTYDEQDPDLVDWHEKQPYGDSTEIILPDGSKRWRPGVWNCPFLDGERNLVTLERKLLLVK